MSSSEILSKLLNDESFLRWLRNNASLEEKTKWKRWLLQHPEHRKVVEKAHKFVTMPFGKVQEGPDKKEQLNELQKKISKRKENKEV